MRTEKTDLIGESADSHDLNSQRHASGYERTAGEICYGTLSRHGWLSLLVLLALVLVRSVAESHRKALWFDEIFSVIVAMQPTWHRFAQAMPADGNPPLFALLVRCCLHLFGSSDLSVRLPSIVSFLAALVGVYVFVRRECGVVLGLLAVVLTFSEPGWSYSYEARPYALLLAFMMLALVSWQSATRSAEATPRRPRRLALAGIVVGIAGGILSHGIGVIEVGLPLLFGEVVRLYRTRRPDWPILATALTAIPAMAIIWPMIHRTRNLLLTSTQAAMHPLTLAKLHRYWIGNLKATLHLVVNSNLIEILVIVILITWTARWFSRRRGDDPADTIEDAPNRVPAHIVAAALGAALLIPATMLAMMSSTGYYDCRYGIGCIAGIAILACLLIGQEGRRQNIVCLSLIVFLVLIFAHPYITEIRHPQARADGTPSIFTTDPSGLPIVISDPFNYARVWWYASPSVRKNIVYLSDKPAAIQPGYEVVEIALKYEKPLISARIEDHTGFLEAHSHFLLDTDSDVRSLFLKNRLEEAAYRATLLRSDGFNTIYEMQRITRSGKMKPDTTTR